jgi:hypothetical protein
MLLVVGTHPVHLLIDWHLVALREGGRQVLIAANPTPVK